MGKRGNVRRGICIAWPKKVAASCGTTSLTRKSFSQVAAAFFSANLSFRNLRRGFFVRKCFPAICGSEFRARFAGLHAGQTALWSRNADFPTNNCIFLTQMVCRVTFGTVGGLGSGLSCDFFSPNGMISLPIGTLNVERKEGGSRHVVGSPSSSVRVWQWA